MSGKLNHFDDRGNAVMVDVSSKGPTVRTAVARGEIQPTRHESYVRLYQQLQAVPDWKRRKR